MLRGQFVILILGVIGVAAALLAVGVRRAQEDRALEYWSPRDALRIRDAGSAELLTLPPPPSGEGVEAAEWPPRDVAQLRDMATATAEVRQRPGASHLWHALLQDESYAWESVPATASRPAWTHALVFEDAAADSPPLVVLLDLEQGWVLNTGKRPPVSIAPVLKFARRVLLP